MSVATIFKTKFSPFFSNTRNYKSFTERLTSFTGWTLSQHLTITWKKLDEIRSAMCKDLPCQMGKPTIRSISSNSQWFSRTGNWWNLETRSSRKWSGWCHSKSGTSRKPSRQRKEWLTWTPSPSMHRCSPTNFIDRSEKAQQWVPGEIRTTTRSKQIQLMQILLTQSTNKNKWRCLFYAHRASSSRSLLS